MYINVWFFTPLKLILFCLMNKEHQTKQCPQELGMKQNSYYITNTVWQVEKKEAKNLLLNIFVGF
jgi:hypothetical protein